MNKTNVMLMFIGSVGLILVAIIFTSIINKTKTNTTTQDIRAKAATKTTTNFLATFDSYDQNTKILTVENMMFEDTKDAKSLGTWNVTVPVLFNPAKFQPGSKLKIAAVPASLDITTNSITALEVRAQ